MIIASPPTVSDPPFGVMTTEAEPPSESPPFAEPAPPSPMPS